MDSWITALSTAMLVVVTGYLAIVTGRTLGVYLHIHAEQTRPYIIASFNSDDHKFVLKIENIGKRPAYDVTVRTEPHLMQIHKLVTTDSDRPVDYDKSCKFGMLPPEHKVRIGVLFVRDLPNLIRDLPNLNGEYETVNVRIEYRDSGNKWYYEDYVVDCIPFEGTVRFMHRTEGHHLSNISEQLSKVVTEIKSLREPN